jgi:prohibitin 1
MMKKAAVITAEGDAEGAKLLAEAFKNFGDGIVELRKMEAAEEIVNDLGKSRNITYLPSGQQTLLALPQ